MSIRHTIALALLVFVALPVSAEVTRTFTLGMRGADVRALQILLNTDPDTRVARSGPGSPGQETDYFGPKTARAYRIYQGKLAKRGQVQPVGTTPSAATSSPQLSTNESGLPGTLAALEVAAKEQGMSDADLAVLKKAVTEQVMGTTTALLPAFVRQVMKDNPGPKPLSLTDQVKIGFTALFGGLVPQTAEAATPCTEGLVDTRQVCQSRLNICAILPASTRAPGGSCAEFADFLGSYQSPLTQGTGGGTGGGAGAGALGVGASAAGVAAGAATAAGIPFGGAIAGTPIFCFCSGTWWIPITPLPPTFPVALTYTSGSQAFLSYNIPFTLWLLGHYEPAPICLIPVGPGCAVLPARGHITPVVGSSPI